LLATDQAGPPAAHCRTSARRLGQLLRQRSAAAALELLRAHPELARTRDDKTGGYPLHAACFYGVEEVAQHIVESSGAPMGWLLAAACFLLSCEGAHLPRLTDGWLLLTGWRCRRDHPAAEGRSGRLPRGACSQAQARRHRQHVGGSGSAATASQATGQPGRWRRAAAPSPHARGARARQRWLWQGQGPAAAGAGRSWAARCAWFTRPAAARVTSRRSHGGFAITNHQPRASRGGRRGCTPAAGGGACS